MRTRHPCARHGQTKVTQAPPALAPYAEDEAPNGDGIVLYDKILTVTRNDRPAGYGEIQRYEQLARRSFVIANLTPDEVEAITKARMSPKHDHLDALLDEQ